MGGPGSGVKRDRAREDSEAARAGLAEEVQRPTRGSGGKFAKRPQVAPPVAVADPLTPEEIQGAGLMVQDGFKLLAQMRGPHWNLVPDSEIDRVGRPTALVLRKYGPMADRYPELSLALILAPGVIGALKVEYDAAKLKAQQARQRQPQPPRVASPLDGAERGDPGAQGFRQNDDGTITLGTPIPIGDR